jgi:polysaccharide chain length determinant protein (PEP-CTERM system associated)
MDRFFAAIRESAPSMGRAIDALSGPDPRASAAVLDALCDPMYARVANALLRDTISPNVIRAGIKHNVIPGEAIIEIDAHINEQNRQLDELRRKYTEQHPDVVGIKRLLAQLEEDRQREIEIRTKAADKEPAGNPMSGDPIAQQLKVALNEAESSVTAVRARLGEYETRYNQLRASAETLPKIDMEFTQLNRDYDMQKRQYENLVARRETASLSGKLEDAGIAEFRIVDPPRVTPNPVAPNRLLLLGAVVAISLLAGLAVSWLVSQTRPTFHDGRSLREVAERPLLGMISMLPTQSLRAVRRRAALLFAGGVTGLLASYAGAFAFLFLAATRAS